MYSVTKFRQPFSAIRKMVEAAFGEDLLTSPEKAREMEGGYCNMVYELSLPIGDFILKIAPPTEVEMMSYEEGMMETEVRMLRFLGANTKVPMPRVIFEDGSGTICPSRYFIMTKISGLVYARVMNEMSPEQKEAIGAELGGFCRQIHAFKGEQFGIIGKPSSWTKDYKSYIMGLFRMLLEDGHRKGSNLQIISYEDLWTLLTDKAEGAGFEDVQIPTLIHWDMWEGNIFVENGHVTGIVDFERCMWSEYLMENGFSGFQKPVEGFLKAYGKVNFTAQEDTRRSFYRLYRYLGMVVECEYRQYRSRDQLLWVMEYLKKELDFLKSR